MTYRCKITWYFFLRPSRIVFTFRACTQARAVSAPWFILDLRLRRLWRALSTWMQRFRIDDIVHRSSVAWSVMICRRSSMRVNVNIQCSTWRRLLSVPTCCECEKDVSISAISDCSTSELSFDLFLEMEI